MQAGRQHKVRRYVRIGAIALGILGVLALGHDRASAQIGVDLLRQAVEKVKGKGKQVPGKELLKGKKGVDKGTADAIKGRLKDKAGFDKTARDKLKDRLSKDGLKDKLSKDKLTKDES